MKSLRTLVLFSEGGVESSSDWRDVHAAYTRAIQSIEHPHGSGQLTLRRKSRRNDGQWRRNGVVALRRQFLRHLVESEGWQPESRMSSTQRPAPTRVRLFPSGKSHCEPVTADFGDFDFEKVTATGLRVAIEWETGNISSSHRSMNKLAIGLSSGRIQMGVLIVPSRALYEHLTDRIGNICELSAYLGLWQRIRASVERGLLAITVVQHDQLTDDERVPYLKVGRDGRSRRKR